MKTSRPARLTCAECQDALEFYLDAETRGADASAHFPAVARHLQTCAACRAAYQQLRDAAHAPGAPALATRDLPFLAAARANAPWKTQVRGRLGGARPGTRFDLPAAWLRGLFAAPAYHALRAADEPERTLLLSDSIVLGTADAAVELWLDKTNAPNGGRIQVEVVSETRLPDSLRVTLRWNGFRYSKTLKHGQATIEKINIPSLQSASSLRVDFETGAHGMSIEEYRGIE